MKSRGQGTAAGGAFWGGLTETPEWRERTSPGAPKGLAATAAGQHQVSQTSLVTEKPTAGTPELRIFIAVMYTFLNLYAFRLPA